MKITADVSKQATESLQESCVVPRLFQPAETPAVCAVAPWKHGVALLELATTELCLHSQEALLTDRSAACWCPSES